MPETNKGSHKTGRKTSVLLRLVSVTRCGTTFTTAADLSALNNRDCIKETFMLRFYLAPRRQSGVCSVRKETNSINLTDTKPDPNETQLRFWNFWEVNGHIGIVCNTNL